MALTKFNKQLFKKIKLIVFDFDGVFTNNKVFVHQDGSELVVCSRSDGIGISKLRKLRVKMFVLSSEPNAVVRLRCKKLDLKCKNNCRNKKEELKKIMRNFKVTKNQTCYIGNDENDIECLKSVGFPVVVSDAYNSVKHYAIYKTRKKGGEGAVRELCDAIYSAKTGSKLNAKTF